MQHIGFIVFKNIYEKYAHVYGKLKTMVPVHLNNNHQSVFLSIWIKSAMWRGRNTCRGTTSSYTCIPSAIATNFYHILFSLMPCRILYQSLEHQGPDLAIAHFVVRLGGAAKFAGLATWFDSKLGNQSQLPGHRVPNLHLEAADCSNTNLLYESFDFFGR